MILLKNTMINRQVYTQKEVQIIDENGEVRVSKLKLPKCTETVDYNWEKVFMDNFLGVVLALCGKKQTQITFYLIKQKNNDNKVNTTQNDIARACNASIQTVSKTITILKRQKEMLKLIDNKLDLDVWKELNHNRIVEDTKKCL